MTVHVLETLEAFRRHFDLPRAGVLLEPDLDVVENDCERHGRKRRDAEVLCTLAANVSRDVLELGTSHGRGAFKLATNLARGLRCHTVNILPEQHDVSGGQMVTHLIPREAIGSYYRERGVVNVEQYYANTARWMLPETLRDLGLVFIDAAHDEANVCQDSHLVWDRIAPGGFMVWHDCSPESRHWDWIDASMRGIERFLRERDLADCEVVNLRHSWCGVLRKPGRVRRRARVEPRAPTATSPAPGAAPMLTPSARRLRFALVYPWYSDARRVEDERFAATVREWGYDVEAIGLPCPGGWWHFPKLDAKWRSRSPDLMSMYEQLEARLRDKDVLIASGGPMLHPEFIRQLPTFNVWVCADDPESSAVLSQPAAPAFDFAFPINLACLEDYRRWGCRHVEWLFPPIRPELSAPELTEAALREGRRDLDVVLLCERVFQLSDRAQRIEQLVRTFPEAYVRGPGWPGGAVEAPPVYRRARIGWNLHNSSGPCNSRTTMLPAFGVLQICDNKSHLGRMFELDREVVGFDTLEECIERTRYYLAHEAERVEIAVAGWQRVRRDYTLERWWDRLVTAILPVLSAKRTPPDRSRLPNSLSGTGPAVRLSPAQAIESVLAKGITYCASGKKLQHIAEAVEEVKRRGVTGIYVEAGVALGGSAIVIASAKPRQAPLKLFDRFDLLPPPGDRDEARAHQVYQEFLDGRRTAPIDQAYLAAVHAGLLQTVSQNLADHGIACSADRVELIKGDFRETLVVDEPVAFAHIDCDWYDSIKLCLERLVERVSPGGVLVFDDYKSFAGARQAVDEWLARDSRFRLVQSDDNVVIERLPEPRADATPGAAPELPVLRPEGGRPRVLLLVDRRGWAYDTAAQAISRRLADEFEFRIAYVREQPDLNAWPFDLIYVFFWGETYHQAFVRDPRRVLKEISSHRWALEEAYGRLSAAEAAARYLADAGTLTATSRRLQAAFAPHRTVHWCPNGFDPDRFAPGPARTGPLRIGWAGNQDDPCKGLRDILEPAVNGDFELAIAGGNLDARAMGEFYRSVDVLCVASTAEGEPLTLVEGMAAGAFPVAVDVGIVPELVRHGEDGLIVNRHPDAFRAAFQWCRHNLDRVRAAGQVNARRMAAERRWDDVAIHWRQVLRRAYRGLEGIETRLDAATPDFRERNLGAQLGEWPARAGAAARAIAALALPTGGSLIDLGCGHGTLRSLLPPGWSYVPVDCQARFPGVTVMDLSQQLPAGRYTVATLLGVLEYFEDAPRLLRWVARHARYLVVSYNDCSSPARRAAQHWRSTLSIAALEAALREDGGRLLHREDLGRAELLYVVEFPERSVAIGCATSGTNAAIAPARRKTLALFSAAENGDNSGDALIVDATRRLLGAHSCRTFPLLQPLSPAQLEEVNACDLAVICGTNLYQHVFACALTPAILEQIRIPILPLGVGSSAPLGGRPTMDAEGVRAVRMIHERCAAGSVRDPASLEFVRSLGIRNVELTGCPVLFHALAEPRFGPPSTDRLCVSVRARLLHVEAHWGEKQQATLRRLCGEFRPTLVLQSPYDLPLGEALAGEFGLASLHDAAWGAGPMIEGVTRATRTAGFRLHFGMLSLAYGRPATFLATDTRTSGFCDMVGVPYHPVQGYRDDDLLQELRRPQPGLDRFLVNWRSLRSAMAGLLAQHDLEASL